MEKEERKIKEFVPHKITYLDKVKINKEDIDKVYREFESVQKAFYQKYKELFIKCCVSSEEKFIFLVKSLDTLWKKYFELLECMDTLYPNLNCLYPKKVERIKELIRVFNKLNHLVYFITDIEKEIYGYYLDSLNKEEADAILKGVKSFPTYLNYRFGHLKQYKFVGEEVLKKEIENNKDLKELLEMCSNSMFLLKNILNNFSDNFPRFKPSWSETTLENKDQLKDALRNILEFDHFIELFFRTSGILKLDVPFYKKICEYLNKPFGIENAIESLENFKNKRKNEFKFNIPKYHQNYDSCGIACLMNVLKTYFPKLKLERSLEKNLLKKVTIPGYYNNIPTSVVKVANEFGLPAFLIIDWDSFRKNYLLNPSYKNFPPLLRFLKELQEIKHENLKQLEPNYVTETLNSGGMISYVGELSGILHYRLIFGYSKKENHFRVFDPILGELKIKMGEISSKSRNSNGFWGVVYYPPEFHLLEELERKTQRSLELIKNVHEKFHISQEGFL